MTETTYQPPKVWTWDKSKGGKFASINRPTSGATHDHELPIGEHSFQLYSLATPNGVKATIMFEELLAAGVTDAEYNAFIVNIQEGEQFGNDFVAINPNSKIPALLDKSTSPPTRIFESGAILVYLAEKFGHFLPTNLSEKAEVMSWLMWQMGSAPFLGGGFGHFYAYAPEKYEYPINRYALEVKRQLDVLDKQLAKNEYIAGDNYTIVDMAIWPWYGELVLGHLYDAATFLNVESYKHVIRWANKVASREAVKRGRIVNRVWGEDNEQLKNRLSASDIDKVLGK